ncbi:MAG TPA: hypothetical protein VMI31_09895 [Fimbriimonadaceae bacterium]|nr:hypothetical protein [Fimbriimonadaceae bacterium]
MFKLLVVEERESAVELIHKEIRSGVLRGAKALVLPITAAETRLFEAEEFADSPNLLILDVLEPATTGIELLARLRSHERTRSLPVVVLLPEDAEGEPDLFYRAGANSCLRRPEEDELCAFLLSVTRYWLGVNVCPPVRI